MHLTWLLDVVLVSHMDVPIILNTRRAGASFTYDMVFGCSNRETDGWADHPEYSVALLFICASLTAG